MIFADKLILLRKKAGWSQEELADQMNVTRQSVSKWEGAQSVPDLEKMLRLSELFGVSTDYLLKDEIEEAEHIDLFDDTPLLRRVSMEEANAFLSVKLRTAKTIAYAAFLCMVRGLKELGVSIYFEEQGIDTAAIDLEMILTFPGMAAQKESETISENMRWSYQKRMESGDFNCCKAAYGYELIDGQLYINEAEAVVIRRIFDLYLQGCGKQAIANQLNTDGIPRRYGYKTWHLNAIHYILNNERYMGDALLQKNYTTETLPFRKRRNRGEKPQYYVENSNPAIVSREVFQAAQALQQRKTAGGSAPKNRYPFSGVLRCPVCGHAYRRQVTNGTAFWLCSYKASGRSECASDRVPENMVKEAFMRMSGKLADNREELLGDLIRQLEKLQNRTSGSGERIYQLNRQIADVNAQNLVVAQLHSSGILNNAEYAAQSGELNRKVSELRSERRRILMEDEDNEVIESLRALDEIMADYAPTEDFDEDLFGQIVESITVVSKNALRFCLAGGLALTERI